MQRPPHQARLKTQHVLRCEFSAGCVWVPAAGMVVETAALRNYVHPRYVSYRFGGYSILLRKTKYHVQTCVWVNRRFDGPPQRKMDDRLEDNCRLAGA
jgi:hypothetical protein